SHALAQLMHGGGRGVDDAAGALAQLTQRLAFLANQIDDSLAAVTERMRPARLGITSRKDLVRGVEEQHLGRYPFAFHFGGNRGPLGKEAALARIDSERDAGEI